MYFHTQEKRSKRIDKPIICNKDNAWLGEAYYFWENEDDAIFWGNKSKTRTGEFEIYMADIESNEILDTVFNKEQYTFFVRQVEKAAKLFVKKTGTKPTLKEINDYFKDKGIWSQLDGILFQDISKNPKHFIVKEFQYKKRIQLALYNIEKVSNFAHHYENICV